MRELRGVDHDHLVDTGLGLQHAGGCIQSHLKIGVLLGWVTLALIGFHAGFAMLSEPPQIRWHTRVARGAR